MKISVIIPVYNGEKTIKRCLDSVLNQTFDDFEVIAVNDGSTDKTLEILNGIDDLRLRVITRENAGQGVARNDGIKASLGEYLAFVDADDTMCEHMLEVMYKEAKESGSQIVQCGIIDHMGDIIAARPIIENKCVDLSDKGEYIINYMYRQIHTNEVCNKLIKKSFITYNNLYFNDTREYYSEDFMFNMRAVQYLSRISFISDAFYNYNISPYGHALRDKEKRFWGFLKLFETVLNEQNDISAKKGIECIAANVLLAFAVAAGKEKEVLYTSSVRGYIKTSMTYKSSLKHRLLMTAILYAPKFIKPLIIRRFFENR